MILSRCLPVVLLCAPCVVHADPLDRLASLRVVAAAGLAAPGFDDGTAFEHFAPISRNDDINTPIPNRSGETAFFASLAGPAIDKANDGSIWSEAGGSPRLVAREGMPAPGLPPGVFFRELDPFPYFSDSGATLFPAMLGGPGVDSSNERSLWIADDGGLRLVVRAGEGVVDDLVTGPIFDSRLNGRGQAAYLTNLVHPDGSFAGMAVWRDGAVVTRSGDFAPGTYATFRQLIQGSLVLSDSGELAFMGWLSETEVLPGVEVNQRNDTGIWRYGSDNVLIAREGDVAPGLETGTFGTFGPTSPFHNPTINSSGDVALIGGVRGEPDPGRLNIYLYQDGALAAAAQNSFPGEEGLMVTAVEQLDGELAIVMNEQGRVMFRGEVIDPDPLGLRREALVLIQDHRLEIAVAELDPAPETEEATYFSNLDILSNLVLNDAGQFAFVADLGGPDVTSENGRGLWALSRQGDLKLIVRTGDEIQLAPGDVRTIETISLSADSGGGDGRRSGLSDLGHVGFKVQFTDGTAGMLVSSRVAVPEPGALVLAIVAIVSVAAGHRLHVRTLRASCREMSCQDPR